MGNPGLIDEAFVNTFIKKRDKELHKGDCGKVLIIAGSEGMAGAAVLSARGALRSGAGLVRVSVPEHLFPILQVGVPEATCVSRSLPPEWLEGHQAIVIGPGLGDDSSNVPLIETVLNSNCPAVVLDADGLNLLARNDGLKELAKEASGRLIITPHPGEAARLLGCSSKEINADRVESACRLAEQIGAVTVLKGAGTLVATPNRETYINTTGNPGMATGGSGDVLSGVIGALAGQGLSCFEAAACGVYIHGAAGDIAAKALGEYGVIASDIAAMIGLAIQKITGS
ncbi:MAG: NAD(P)H-hydrate dehydratase [Bacillota bacterium]|jgi:NAD(P)H-hydrate epimerase|nr:NAD(P)H-hydrate dehydratase [Bacillota bacterium]NLM08253.1 NAD(P)H-hydrate dehydratase [Clostridiales Family XIII bacterium]